MTRKYESTAVMLRPDQLARLRARSEETDMPMSVMHRQAVDDWLERNVEGSPPSANEKTLRAMQREKDALDKVAALTIRVDELKAEVARLEKVIAEECE